MTATYSRRRARRDAQREVAFLGESLAAYLARANAKPPTLREIYAANRADKTVCPRTADMFGERFRLAGRLPRAAVAAIRRRCGVGR